MNLFAEFTGFVFSYETVATISYTTSSAGQLGEIAANLLGGGTTNTPAATTAGSIASIPFLLCQVLQILQLGIFASDCLTFSVQALIRRCKPDKKLLSHCCRKALLMPNKVV